MFEDNVKNTLKKGCGVFESDLLLLGFSGGSDSVCLLHILASLKFKVLVAYFNHNLRGSVDDEVRFARDAAERYGFESVIGSKQISKIASETGKGIEETAREYRYRFLANKAEQVGAKAIVVAHHADDQVETIIMHMIRGTGLQGLVGMQYKSLNGICGDILIVRPLLGIWKDEILAYCVENDLDYQIDDTNQDIQFTRNNVRKVIIPELEKINPKFKQGILRMQQLLASDQKALEGRTEELINNVILESKNNFFRIEIDKFLGIHSGMQRRIIRFALEKYFMSKTDTSFQMVEDIRKVLLGEVKSDFSAISDRINVSIEHGYGYVYSNSDNINPGNEPTISEKFGNRKIQIPGITKICDTWSFFCEKISRADAGEQFFSNRDPYNAFIDIKKAGRQLIVRKRKDGDRYAPMGMDGHSMKLTDFWINKKLPKRLRLRWPLICAVDRIIWIPGFQPAHDVIVSDQTEEILKIKLVKKD